MTWTIAAIVAVLVSVALSRRFAVSFRNVEPLLEQRERAWYPERYAKRAQERAARRKKESLLEVQ